MRADQVRDLWQALEPLTAEQISDSSSKDPMPAWPLSLYWERSVATNLHYLLLHFKQFKRFIEACAQREDVGLLIRFA